MCYTAVLNLASFGISRASSPESCKPRLVFPVCARLVMALNRGNSEDDVTSQTSATQLGQAIDMSAILEESLSEIDRRLRRAPNKILPILEILRKQDVSANSRKRKHGDEGATSKLFHSSYVKVHKIPKDFWQEVLAELTGGRVSQTEFEKIERQTPGTVKELGYFATALTADTKWPKHGKNSDVLKAALKGLHSDLSSPLANLAVLRPSSSISIVAWTSTFGFYNLVPTEGNVKVAIKHVHSGQEVRFQGLQVDTSVEGNGIVANNDENKAMLQAGSVKMVCAEFFTMEQRRNWPSMRHTERFSTELMSVHNNMFGCAPAASSAGGELRTPERMLEVGDVETPTSGSAAGAPLVAAVAEPPRSMLPVPRSLLNDLNEASA
eukprot:1844765-Amphidinium_carterae.1